MNTLIIRVSQRFSRAIGVSRDEVPTIGVWMGVFGVAC